MDYAVRLHEADDARPQPEPRSGRDGAVFFQSASRSGSDHAPPVDPTPISRFATSA